MRAGGEDHAELHCIPDRPSALRVGRLALFARHLLSADASRARAEQRNATQREVKARQSEGQRGAAKGSERQKHGTGSAEPRLGQRLAECQLHLRRAPAEPCFSAKIQLCWVWLAIDSWRFCATCCSSAFLPSPFLRMPRTRLRVAVPWLSSKPANPTRSLNPVEAAKRSLLLFCALWGPLLLLSLQSETKTRRTLPLHLGTALHMAAGVGGGPCGVLFSGCCSSTPALWLASLLPPRSSHSAAGVSFTLLNRARSLPLCGGNTFCTVSIRRLGCNNLARSRSTLSL